MRLLLLLLFLPLLATAQHQFLGISVDEAKALAAARGTFIVLDFYASWCGPCITMDERVWSSPAVAEVQQPFVNVRVDATHDRNILLQYGLKGIPALIVIDADGNEYFRRLGFMDERQVISALSDFPHDMSGAYAASILADEQPDAFNAHFLLGRHYQEAARQAVGPVRAQLAKESSDALETSLDILNAQQNTPPSLQERLELMMAENLLLRNKAKKALKALDAMAATVHEKNEALACYVRSLAYQETKQPELARECYDKLKEATDNEAYLALYAAQSDQ